MNASDIAAVSMEKVGPADSIRKLAKGGKWMQNARARMKKKGTEGSLTRIAKSHGESAMEFAHEHYHDSGAVGKKARFAVNAQK